MIWVYILCQYVGRRFPPVHPVILHVEFLNIYLILLYNKASLSTTYQNLSLKKSIELKIFVICNMFVTNYVIRKNMNLEGKKGKVQVGQRW